MKQNIKQSDIDSYNRVGTIMKKILNTITILTGVFFSLMGTVGIMTGDYFFGGIILIAGLIIIPYVRNTIARLSNTPRISGIMSIVIFFSLIIVMGITLPSTENISNSNDRIEQITPIVTPITIPTPEDIKKDARNILPGRDELSGSGWTRKIITHTDKEAEAKYYKDDHRITIKINVCDDITTAYQLYYTYRGDMEYPPIEYKGDNIGDLSMVGLVAEESYGISSFRDGYFIKSNVVVSISIFENSWGSISAKDIGRYAKQVEKAID